HVAGADEAAVGVRAALAEAAAVQHRDRPPRAAQVVGARGADHPAAHHDNSARAAHVRMPVRNGSPGPRSSIASAVTNVEPVMRGITLPPSTRAVPSKMLPTMLSCRQTSPSRSLRSATRQASLALVPVPQGERSYAPPGQSTKLRLCAVGSRGG